jgi:hypothetical protein
MEFAFIAFMHDLLCLEFGSSVAVLVENRYAGEVEKLRHQYTNSPADFPRELLARDDKYRTKLATALEESSTEMVTCLLSLGAGPNLSLMLYLCV